MGHLVRPGVRPWSSGSLSLAPAHLSHVAIPSLTPHGGSKASSLYGE